ncbi:MAG: paraquat-inducible protein A [Phycisphaeraceae bacterium]|nr:paraquat-inducible protein A [Phycisphaerales bacterium]MCB9861189.1 paraquat-inducible protein A [Phycisphaeraceae bacterium]
MQPDNSADTRVCACHACGLVQTAPAALASRLRCCRCSRRLDRPRSDATSQWAAALCVTALLLYIPAMSLPILEVERFGHRHSSTIWSGIVELMAENETGIALIVLFSSIVAPIGKLLAMLFVTLGHPLAGPRPRAIAFRVVEWLGRWGMVDVLLVAVLVAAVKLGSVIEVKAGAGAITYASVVVCSLLASAVYHPHTIWQREDHSA